MFGNIKAEQASDNWSKTKNQILLGLMDKHPLLETLFLIDLLPRDRFISSLFSGLLSVSYDEWDYGLEARVRDGVAIITMATSAMMMDRGPHTLLKSECHGAPEKKTPISGNPNEVLR